MSRQINSLDTFYQLLYW